MDNYFLDRMPTVRVGCPFTVSPGARQRIKRQLKRRKITQDVVAAEAGVTRTMVVHYFAGRTGSDRVQLAAETLLAKRRK